MTGWRSLVAGLALMLAAAAMAFVLPAGRLLMAWTRIWNLAVFHGLYDSGRQAERASHTSGGHRAAPPERGWCVPGLAMRDGLPVRWRLLGRISQAKADHAAFLADVEHVTGMPWTLERRRRSRVLELAQAPPLPAVPPLPPVPLSPWLLPIGHGHHGPVWWDVREQYHLLVVAITGWWKSSFALWLTQRVSRTRGWYVVVIDPRTDSLQAQLATLRLLVTSMDGRDPDAEPVMRTLVVLDEFDGTMEPTTKAADPDYALRAELRRLVRDLLTRGGLVGFHVLALAQDPRSEAVGRGIRSKFGIRIGGGLDKAEWPLVFDAPVPYSRKGRRGQGWWLVKGGIPAELVVHSTARQRRESEGPSETTAERIIPAIGSRKWR